MRTISLSTPNLKTQALVTNLVQGQLYGFTVKAKNYGTIYSEETAEVTATPRAQGQWSLV